MLLMDRVFRQQGILAHQPTPLDRLAFVGHHGMGALSFEPSLNAPSRNESIMTLNELGRQAQAVFEGQASEVLATLAQAGCSGGARPKAQVLGKPYSNGRCLIYLPAIRTITVKTGHFYNRITDNGKQAPLMI
jgi:serine/threonine-protein kinase HipA